MRNPFRRFFRKPAGFPLGQHVPADPADHAQDFAHRYADRLDWLVAIKMEKLGIANDQIGSNDHNRGLIRAAFNPWEREGGGNGPGRQINLDSGIFNPDLMKRFGRKAHKAWRDSSVDTRAESAIAHEYEKAKTGSHVLAVERAPHTELPISHEARELARVIREGVRRR